MTNDWRVQVYDAGGRVCGGGVLLSRDLVLTCAHVVAEALGTDGSGAAPTAAVTVGFPAAHAPPARAAVAVGGWDPAGGDGAGDLAVLRLAEPVDLDPAVLDPNPPPVGTGVWVFGHPADLPTGAWAQATVTGAGGPAGTMVQLVGSAQGRRIERGYGGCGVMDDAGTVIGLVVGEDLFEAARGAWMLPVRLTDRLPVLAHLLHLGAGWQPDYVDEFVDALLAVPGLTGKRSRDRLARELRERLGDQVALPRDHESAQDLLGFVQSCMDLPDEYQGLEVLHGALSALFGTGGAVRRVGALVGQRPLLHSGERARVVELLRQPDAALLATVARGIISQLGTHNPLDVGDLDELVEELAELGVPLVLLLFRLAERSDGDLAGGFYGWHTRFAKRLGLTGPELARLRAPAPEEPPRPSRSYVVVELREHAPDPERFLMSVWLQHDAGGGDRLLSAGDDEPLTLAEVERRLDALLRGLATGGLDVLGELTIEFVLPHQLLGHPVDQWQVTPAARESTFARELGMEYPVVVRSLERARNQLTRARWLRRWNWLRRYGAEPGAIQWLELGAAEQAVVLAELRFSGEDRPACMILCGPTNNGVALRQAIEAVLEAGIPALLWCRDDRDVDRFRADTDRMLVGRALTELPRTVLRHRLDAVRLGRPPEHLGLHLSLIWDDPERLPPTTRTTDTS